MPHVPFDTLPPDARLWIFGAERPLTESERARVLDEVGAFIGQWAAHDVPLTTASDLRYDQFIFVAVDERAAGASGCSIDALVRRMKGLAAELGVVLVNHAPVLYRDADGIACVSRERFGELVASGRGHPGDGGLRQHPDHSRRRSRGSLGAPGGRFLARSRILLARARRRLARGREAFLTVPLRRC